MIVTKQTLLSDLEENKEKIQAFGVHRLGLFGSFVREENQPQSDIDLIVEFEPDKKNFDNFFGLCSFLESLFDRNIELITREGLSPYIGPYILSEVEYVSFAN
jgi:hypothetical protein